jgi:hypothetical protein
MKIICGTMLQAASTNATYITFYYSLHSEIEQASITA